MIVSLGIQNVALIEQTEISFCAGLNIISGETGAGKSMVLDALDFILGGRASKDFVRIGEEGAEVECVLEVTDENKQTLGENGIEIDYDNLIVIKRTMSESGKSSCKINGKTVSVSALKEISRLIFDIHSQHEHQSLLNQSKHINVLDKFCELSAQKKNLETKISKLRDIASQIEEIGGDAADRTERIELYRFQIEEIEAAAPKAGEETELLGRKKFLDNAQGIIEKTANAIEVLSEETSALDLLRDGRNYLRQLSNLDENAEPFLETIETICIQLDELIGDLGSYSDNLEIDENELEEIENRLNLLYKLKRKYGKTTEEILQFLENAKVKYDKLINSDALLETLRKELESTRLLTLKICQEITKIRAKTAKVLEKKITQSLQDLGMKGAFFSISVTPKEDFTNNGADDVAFMIQTNAGDVSKPLAKIASGGEISRVMLALKTVLASAESAETFVFDEIDTGVSGRTAQKVAEKLVVLSKTRQLLCITHLPQIAAMADCHFLVEKSTKNDKTTTRVYELDDKNSIKELARLIGGAQITDATLLAATELKHQI
ncbi:DNA repair protein RecN [Clostridia bacterium]|nr:DNA repair protein RecN [Clostridia bacterium]